ncbi:MAG TPA: bifunctional folylpolyglutamate synthase/dihydrofolate synthase, partial [Acidimicrobiaceae bacterium]|nr:bifunctional folylpolyglutamate synthase/dihydrofolate synthase [Acidimicrobiaceae bacterium]
RAAARAAGADPAAVHEAPTIAAGIEHAVAGVGADGLVLVTGSLYVVSEARAHLGINRR